MASYPRGIDVSKWQGSISWDQVAASGIQFALIKSTQGTFERDAWFDQNWAECGRLAMLRGCYHYANPSRFTAEAEADYFLGQIDGMLSVGDVVALDFEDPYFAGDGSDWVMTWLERVHGALGFRPLVYTNPSYATSRCLANRPELSEYGLWLAHWLVPTPPPAPPPWSLVAIHQIGVGPPGTVPGVDGSIDVNRFNGSIDQFARYGKPAESGAPPEPSAPERPADLPVYDWQEPSRLQENDWSCSQDATEWALWAWGRQPEDDWMESSMQAAGVISPAVGLTDATGGLLAQWINDEYAELGYWAENIDPISFDELAAEAATLAHPLMAGGRGWNHWTGVRTYAPESDCIILANPSPGWMGVGDVLSRYDWERLGPWSAVRLTHPAAESWVPPEPEPPEPEPAPEPEPPPSIWTETVGSGLLEMMAADATEPAQSASVWIGGPPAEIEQCWGKNGVLYCWLMSEGRGVRITPS